MKRIVLILAVVLCMAGCKREASFEGKTQTKWMTETHDKDEGTAQRAMWALEEIDQQQPDDKIKARVAEMKKDGYQTLAAHKSEDDAEFKEKRAAQDAAAKASTDAAVKHLNDIGDDYREKSKKLDKAK